MQKKQRPLLGAHMSIAGGIEKSILRGKSIGCTTIQVFTKNNRTWKASTLTNEKINLFKKTAKKNRINPIIAHASYLINIGTNNREIHEKSRQSLYDELNCCQKLNIPYLVLHPGSCKNSTETECLDIIAATLDYIFSKNSGQTMILLENMSGQGATIGNQLEQLATIYNKSKFKKRLGICLDTCHAYAAGYKFDTPKTYNAFWSLFDKILGIEHLKCIHLNDSKKECSSKIDRHEHIGKGKINFNTFKLIMNDERLFNVPKIIETPKEKGLESDKYNMEKLIKLISAP